MRCLLDKLYTASGVAAAVCLAGICVLMLAQALARETGHLLRGADDIAAWLCAGECISGAGAYFSQG